ncbi:hypothetical protein DITRI_Ditri09bG0030000 [Diplodiscus trichospermus]
MYRRLIVYPRGTVAWRNLTLSVFLELVEAFNSPPKRKVYAQFKLRVKDQFDSNYNRERTENSA